MFVSIKTKNTPAHPGKFPPAPPSPSASAFFARSVKGRFALRYAMLHYALDLLARLRLPLLTTAAPREISSQGRRYKKTENTVSIFSPCPPSLSPFPFSCFPGSPFSLSSSAIHLFSTGFRVFPRPREMLSGSGAFIFLPHSSCFPFGCLFVRHHPGRPAYVSCTRAAALYPLRLARGFAPLTPARPAKGSGLAKGKRRKSP